MAPGDGYFRCVSLWGSRPFGLRVHDILTTPAQLGATSRLIIGFAASVAE